MAYLSEEKMYKALANRRRLAIMVFLKTANKATVGAIADHINLSLKATSKHLQILKNANMVGSRQISLEQHYYLVRTNKYGKQFFANL